MLICLHSVHAFVARLWVREFYAAVDGNCATSNPLVAQYSIRHFHAGLTAWVEFGTDAKYGRQTSTMTSSVTTADGLALNILVAGMRPQTTYHMRAHVDWTGGSWVDQDRTFTTGALPHHWCRRPRLKRPRNHSDTPNAEPSPRARRRIAQPYFNYWCKRHERTGDGSSG